MDDAPPPTVDAVAEDADRAIAAAPDLDLYARAAAVKHVMRAFDRAAGIDDAAERRRAAAWLRGRLVARLEDAPLGDPAALARAVVALELLASINESARRVADDFPGLRERIGRVADRLGLGPVERRRVRHHLVFEHYGDLGMSARAPHLCAAFFRLVLDDPGELGARAARLYGAMIGSLAGYVDYFLWYHLWRTGERDDPRRVRDLFAANDAGAVARSLEALLGDDAAYEAMLADRDLRHSGRMKLVVGRYQSLGMEHVRRLVRGRGVARWIDLAGGLSTYYLGEPLGVADRPSYCFDALDADEASLTHVLPLRIGPGEPLRLMDPAEIDAYAARIRASAVVRRRVDLLRPGELAAAALPFDGATLYTSGGSYLGSIRPEDDGMREEAVRRQVSGARVGAMRMAEAMLSVLRPGDLLALFGRAGIPYFRGVTWLILAASADGRLAVRGVGRRTGYPKREERWDLV
jgi:hypothetical protein